MNRTPRFRRGATVHEAVATIALAMAAMTGVAQLLAVNARQWVAAQQRATAAREAGNFMEEVFSRPWAELSAAEAPVPELPADSRNLLPDAHVELSVQREETSPDAVLVRVQIDWINAAGQRARPVRLTAWRYRSEEGAP